MRTLLAALAVMAAAAIQSAEAGPKKLILGVVYEGCEYGCQGFEAGIVESGLDAEVVIRDIDQDKSLLPQVVEEARAMGADLVMTWGTSVTLGIVGTMDDLDDPRFLNDIPVVFMVVADPFGTRIAESFDGTGRPNLAGTFNRVPESVNVEVIRQYDPTVEKLGLLYHRNERNSVVKLEELTALAPTVGIELVALELDPGNDAPPDPATIPQRMAELREKGVRWLYLGSSSYLRLNGGLFTSSAVENGIAVLSPYESLVREQQALLSVAARYEDIGRLAAEQALRILRDGVPPGDLPIVRATEFAYVVNMDVARMLDRYPPFAFMQVAETVGN